MTESVSPYPHPGCGGTVRWEARHDDVDTWRCQSCGATVTTTVARKCMTLGCPRPADVILIVNHPELLRRERPYCTPCADERRRLFSDRIKDEVTL